MPGVLDGPAPQRRRRRKRRRRGEQHRPPVNYKARRQRRSQSLPHRCSSSSSRLRADYSFPLFLACPDSDACRTPCMDGRSRIASLSATSQSSFHGMRLDFRVSAEPAFSFSLNLSASSISRRRPSSSSLLHACPAAGWSPAGRLVTTTSIVSHTVFSLEIIIMQHACMEGNTSTRNECFIAIQYS